MFLLKYNIEYRNLVSIFDAVLLRGNLSKKSLYSILLGVIKDIFPNSIIDFSIGSLDGVYKLSFEIPIDLDFRLDGEVYQLRFQLCGVDVIEV